MERRKFVIDGREYETYELSNEQMVRLANSKDLTDADKAFIKDKIVERFMNDCCARCGEDNNDVFARQFSDYVNRCPNNFKKAAKRMSMEHRYLQNEMFKVCLEYIKKLAENCENGYYDPRNKYAAETSKKIIDYFKEVNYPY
jgi:hypothetical protein